MRRAFLTALLVWLVAGAGVASANRLVTITIPARHGEIPSKWLDYPGPPRANVLLPDGYNPARRYPLVLNLGGLGGDYKKATFGTGLHIPAILVTPEPLNGWYTDWWNGGKRGDPAWESYYLDEVMPYILRRYPIRPGRRWHAVEGISMGGLGATFLGGRLPGFFGTVASLSGFVDPQFFAEVVGPGMGVTSYAAQHGDYYFSPVLGPPRGFYADGHNPTRLVENLAHTRVFASTGNGVPSDSGLTDPGNVPSGSVLEGIAINPMNQLFDEALTAARIPHTYVVHRGGHDSRDFDDEIKAMLAWGLFKPVVERPRSWANETVASHGQLWDVGYRFARPPTQLVRFRRTGSILAISAAGSLVTLTTSGRCTIRTRTPVTVRVPSRRCRAASRH
jgi:S-formylglutathione hydrolase FrmB